MRERNVNFRGLEKVIGMNNITEEEYAHKCYLLDIIEEICLVDNRAGRLLYHILDKLGSDALDDSRLESFIGTHTPGYANYKLLLNWICEIQRAQKVHKNNMFVSDDCNHKVLSYISDSIKDAIGLEDKQDYIDTLLDLYNEINMGIRLNSINWVRTINFEDKVIININTKVISVKVLGYEYRMEPKTFLRLLGLIDCLTNKHDDILEYHLRSQGIHIIKVR